jgi:hypothetical protein
VIHESRKRGTVNEDGSFMPHQKGPITSIFTTDWIIREKGRELLGEWMKMTSVRSQVQRRMLRNKLAHLPNERVDSQKTNRKESPNKTWSTSSIPVKSYQQST